MFTFCSPMILPLRSTIITSPKLRLLPSIHAHVSHPNASSVTSSPSIRRHRRRPRKPNSNSLQPDVIQTAQRAPTVRKLLAARSKLRRQTGVDPPPHDILKLVSGADAHVPNEHPEWKSVIDARNKITLKWLWLVSAIAHKLYRTYSQSFPEMRAAICPTDLVQEGFCGLMNAVEKWDSNKGCPFDAFAFYTIKYSIIRAVQNQSRPIRLPVHVLDKLAKMRKVRQKLEANNRKVSVDAIARGAGVSCQAAELYLNRSKSTMSIDAPLSSNSSSYSNTSSHSSNSTPLRDFLVDHSVDVAREVERSCTREAVARLVNSSDLLELERSVLFLKYGLGDGIERVRAEVSRILDVRVTSVRRAELSALKKLRHYIGNDAPSWTELIS